MKYSFIMSVFFLLLSPNVSAAIYTTYTHDEYNISFEYPADWTMESAVSGYSGKVEYVWIDRIEEFNAPRISVRWSKYPSTDTKRDIHRKENLEEVFTQITDIYDEVIVLHEDDSNLFGHVALRYRIEGSRSDRLISEEWVLVDFNGTIVEFGYKATPSNFDQYYNRFEHLKETFSLQKPTPEPQTQEPLKQVTKEEEAEYLRWRPFSDVPVDAWYARDLLDARAAGWVSGYKDKQGKPLNKFGPADPVTFAEMLKMIMTAKILLPSPSSEQAAEKQVIDHWSNEYVAEALARNIIPDSLQDLILSHPDKPITRAETAEMTYAFFPIDSMNQDQNDSKFNGVFLDEIPEFKDVTNNQYQHSIYSLVRVGIFTGDTNANGTATGYFRPNDTLNRAEALMIAVRSGDRNCLFLTNVCPHNITRD